MLTAAEFAFLQYLIFFFPGSWKLSNFTALVPTSDESSLEQNIKFVYQNVFQEY